MTGIDWLKLSHFRSHRFSEVRPEGRTVVLFGANGAGKTNVLEAVSLLSPGRGLRRAKTEEMARAPERLGWKVAGSVQAHEIETRAEPSAVRQVIVDGKPATQTALGSLVRIVWLTPAMDRLWTEGASERRRFLDRLALGFFPEHATATLAYEKAMRERNRLLKEQVGDPFWYRALEAQLAEHGAAIQAHRVATVEKLSRAQTDAATAFPAAALTLSFGESEPWNGAEDLAMALEMGRRRDLIAGRTLTGPHRADLLAVYARKDIEAALCSTGEQKALLISLVLASARALREDTGEPPILLLDEVAAHLDADRRAALYGEVAALSAQAWMTGTGPELFASMVDDALRIEVSENAGESRLSPRP